MRLLCDPLFNSWEEGKPFEALTDVGLFWKPDNEGKYVEYASPHWLPEIGLGLTLWKGPFQDVEAEWLRFVDKNGALILTGTEQAAVATKRASEADARAKEADARAKEAESEVERLRRKLREMGAEE